jgi:hypothetical protein
MKNHSLVLALVFCLLSSWSFSGNDNFPIGARSAGVANASLTYADVWSLWQNQAGIANLKEISAGVFYDNQFMLSELALKAFGIAMPLKNIGVFGLSYTGFGYSLYNETKLGLCYAKSYRDVFSFGMQLDYLNTTVGDGYGSNNAIAAEAGFQAKILPELVLAAHIYNPTEAKINAIDKERIPSILRMGLAYTFSDKVICSMEIEKDISQQENFKAGVEYHAVKQFYLRCGISTNPVSDAFGFGLVLKEFKMDFSETIYQQLGSTPAISFSYSFK